MSFIHTNRRSFFSRFNNRVKLLNLKVIMLAMSLCICSAYSASSMANDDFLTRAQAVEIAKQRSGNGARVLGVKETKAKNGNVVYAVKVIKNGRVKVYQIPAKPRG